MTATYVVSSCEYGVLGDLFFKVRKTGDSYSVDLVGTIASVLYIVVVYSNEVVFF